MADKMIGVISARRGPRIPSMNLLTPTRSAARACALTLGVFLWAGGIAAAADLTPAQRTVGLFSYVDTGSDMKPGRSFSGVMVDSTHIATSLWALSQGPDQIGVHANSAAQVYVSYYTPTGKLVTFPVRVSLMDPKAAVAILTINESERSATSRFITTSVRVMPLEISADARAVGVIAPEPLSSDQINLHTAPAPIAMRIEAGLLAGSGDMAFAPVNHPLPPSMVGGGVWNSEGQLLGILTRHDDSLQIADAAAIKSALSGAVVTPAPIRKPPATDPPVAITPTPTVPAVPKDPSALSEADTAEMLKNLKPLLDRMKYAKLSLAIDPGLLDYVNQDQADLVMERIGGGKFAEALSTLDTIEALTSGTLADQLNYRRALTLTLLGRYADARPKAQRAAAAADSLVRARGRALSKALEDCPDGVAKNGKSLSDSATLAALMRVAGNLPDNGSTGTPAANPASEEFRKSIESAFQTAKGKQLDNRASYDMIDQQLQSITKRIDAANASGLESLAKEVAAYRSQLLRREYERASAELLTLQQKYQDEFSQLQFRNGPEWATAGYAADIHLAKANAIIDNFNTALKHFQIIGQQLGGEKNTDDSLKPMPPLPIAKRIDGR